MTSDGFESQEKYLPLQRGKISMNEIYQTENKSIHCDHPMIDHEQSNQMRISNMVDSTNSPLSSIIQHDELNNIYIYRCSSLISSPKRRVDSNRMLVVVAILTVAFAQLLSTSGTSISTRQQLSASVRFSIQNALSRNNIVKFHRWNHNSISKESSKEVHSSHFGNTRIFGRQVSHNSKNQQIDVVATKLVSNHNDGNKFDSEEQNYFWNDENSSEVDELSMTETAFGRVSSDEDYWHIRTVQSALLRNQKSTRNDRPAILDPSTHFASDDELDFLLASNGCNQQVIPASRTIRPNRLMFAHPRGEMAKTSSKKIKSNGSLNSSNFNQLTSSESNIVHDDQDIQKTLASIPQNLRAGAIAKLNAVATRPLQFWESMVCGAISRSVAQTTMHPANTMKTILQNSRKGSPITIGNLIQPKNFRMLTRGAGANFLLSVPHGAINFAVLEFVRRNLGEFVSRNEYLKKNENKFGAGLDFLSSAVATITCSVVSTPQMMITDNIMVGNYPNLAAAISGLAKNNGMNGFYAGWWPGLVGKIPSYALTWTIFQQLKRMRDSMSNRPATDLENSIMGCIASSTSVTIMIPMDTIKTRLVAQAGMASSERLYTGIIDCATKVLKEEGLGAFYRGLPPRLVSVVPMIGIQFGVYEFIKRRMLQRKIEATRLQLIHENAHHFNNLVTSADDDGTKESVLMEVAASLAHPYPVPHMTHHHDIQHDAAKAVQGSK